MKYYNLTQAKGNRMCYFRSIDIEQKNWKRILWSFPDEILYFMYLGKEIEIIDKSTKKRNKVERILIPVVEDLLNWLYFGKTPKYRQLSHHFIIAKQTLELDNMLMTKFKYWKQYIKKINIKGRTIQVKKEIGLGSPLRVS